MSKEAATGIVDAASDSLAKVQLSQDTKRAATEAKDDTADMSEPEDLDELIEQISSEDLPTRFFGIQSLRRRVADDTDTSYARLLHSKAFGAIVGSLGNDQLPDLQFECAWVITNLLSHRQERLDLLTRGGLCEPLVKLLGNSADRTKEQACWALGNIVGECAQWRDQTLSCGLLPALVALLESKPTTGILDAVSLLIVNLFRDKEPRVSFEVVKALLPHCVKLLDHPHAELVPHIIWSLSYMAEESEPRCRLLLQQDILDRLIAFLDSKEDAQLIPTLRVFSTISSVMTPMPGCVLAEGSVLKKMRLLLDHPDAKVRRQVLFFVSNVSDGPDSHLQQIVDAGFPARVGLILLEGDESEKREAFWIVPNFIITRGSAFKSIIIEHCLEGFLETLTLKDAELTHCVLLSVREMLLNSVRVKDGALSLESLKGKIEKCGGVKKIEMAQQLDDEDLKKMSYQIIDHFFWHNGEMYANELVDNDNATCDNNEALSPEGTS